MNNKECSNESETITVGQASASYGYHKVWYLAAVRLGFLTPKKLKPVLVLRADVKAFVHNLDVSTLRQIRAELNSKKPPRRGEKKSIVQEESLKT